MQTDQKVNKVRKHEFTVLYFDMKRFKLGKKQINSFQMFSIPLLNSQDFKFILGLGICNATLVLSNVCYLGLVKTK